MQIMSLYFWKDQRFIYVYNTEMYIIEIRLKSLKLYAKNISTNFLGVVWNQKRSILFFPFSL